MKGWNSFRSWRLGLFISCHFEFIFSAQQCQIIKNFKFQTVKDKQLVHIYTDNRHDRKLTSIAIIQLQNLVTYTCIYNCKTFIIGEKMGENRHWFIFRLLSKVTSLLPSTTFDPRMTLPPPPSINSS